MRTILLTSALLTTMALAQEQQPSPSAEVRATQAGVEKWIQQLGADSYRDRLQAEEELRQLGEKARAALERAAKDDSDSEVQWRAKRLLREFGKAPAKAEGRERDGRLTERRRDRRSRGGPEIVERRDRGLAGIDDMRAEFDRIFKRFEDMGLDVPSRRFFEAPFFKDLESQLDRPWGLGSGAAAGQGMSVQIGPGGVRVEVTEKGEDGEVDTKVYEAPDLETFREKFPGVLQERGLSLGLGGFDVDLDNLEGRIGKVQRGFDWDLARPRVLRLPRQGGQDALSGTPMPQQGRRLGVSVKPIPAPLRDYLELDEGVGLMVADVQDDTLAKACGLRVDDIVVAIGDQPVGSPADVAEALGAIKKGDKVRVAFVRRGQRQTAETEKRHDAAPKRDEVKPAGERREIR
ncbi:MAG: PDZ domain-containing protein [Planctomycetes bacterium]|nr:PDZ domain-containing protein [Planctomycetota bacterium]